MNRLCELNPGLCKQGSTYVLISDKKSFAYLDHPNISCQGVYRMLRLFDVFVDRELKDNSARRTSRVSETIGTVIG